MHTFHRIEDVVSGGRHFAYLLQFMGKHVKQHFGIGIGVDMAQVLREQLFAELCRVGQVAVVSQAQPVGRVDIKRLSQRRAGAARGRVTHVTDTHVAGQPAHVPGTKYILDQTVVLAQIQYTVVVRCDPCSILPAMLKHRQGIV